MIAGVYEFADDGIGEDGMAEPLRLDGAGGRPDTLALRWT
jgi:hypothetical protein